MANNTISLRNQQLFDPGVLAQSAPYVNNGLTYKSNNIDIHPRDESGNIILQENSETNPLLIIEPVTNNVLNRSVLKVIDTAFQYYKFPVTTKTTPIADLDVNIGQLDIPEVLLKLPVPLDSQQQPVSYDRINTSYESQWFYNDGATNSSGLKELPWLGGQQITPNSYTLNQSTIDLLRNQNKTLKFSIIVQFRAQTPSLETGYIVELRRNNQSYTYNRQWKNITLYQIDKSGDGYPYFRFDYILNEQDMFDQDTYKLFAVSGNPAWSLNESALWKIEAVDINGYTNRILYNGDLDDQQRSRITYLEFPEEITVNGSKLN